MRSAFLFLVFLFPFYVLAESPLRVEGKFFKDKKGRVILLRGYNLTGASKVPPFHLYNDKEDLNQLAKIGANVVRLTVNWEGLEPERGKIDHQYLNHLKEAVEKLEKLGIYVILDMHQDGFSRFANVGCGSGFPKWAIAEGLEVFEPKNDQRCESWYRHLLSRQNRKVFDSFYLNSHGQLTSYFETIRFVARTFRNFSNVIGFDPINEPWGSRSLLEEFYDKVVVEFRAEFPSAIIFITPHGISPTGIFMLKLRKPNFSNYAYAAHYYAPSINPLKHWSGINTKYAIKKLIRFADRIDAPLFIGEFGSPFNTKKVNAYITSLYNSMDKYFVSGAQWEFNPLWTEENKDGWNREDFSVIGNQKTLRQNYVSRPTVRAIPGEVKKIKSKPVSESASKCKFVTEIKWKNRSLLGTMDLFVPQDLSWELMSVGNLKCFESTKELSLVSCSLERDDIEKAKFCFF